MTSCIFRWIGVVAVCLVVTIHLPTCENAVVDSMLHEGIARVAVPWFFFASGFWLFQNGKRPNWMKRLKGLLIPYLLANVLWFVFMCGVEFAGRKFMGFPPSRFSFTPVNVLSALGLFYDTAPALVPTWFLRSLMLFMLVAALCNALVKQVRITSCLLMAISIVLVFVDYSAEHFFPQIGFACFSLGLLVRTFFLKGECRPCGTNVLMRNVFSVYLLHVPIILTMSYALRPIHCWDWTTTTIGHFALWIFVTAASFSLAELSRRKLPRFSRLLYGGR